MNLCWIAVESKVAKQTKAKTLNVSQKMEMNEKHYMKMSDIFSIIDSFAVANN